MRKATVILSYFTRECKAGNEPATFRPLLAERSNRSNAFLRHLLILKQGNKSIRALSPSQKINCERGWIRTNFSR